MIKGQLSEKQIENQILSWLKFKGIFAWKIKSVGTYDPKIKRFRSLSPWYKKGCPDILCCIEGKLIGLEVKTPKGSLSIHQKLFHEELLQAGGKVYIIRDVKELEPIFANIA